MTNAILNVDHLKKAFGDNVVLKDIDFSVSSGEVISIIGSSGSGKSTLLRCLNLLEEPTEGDIRFHDQSILASHFDKNKFRDNVGILFKQFILV